MVKYRFAFPLLPTAAAVVIATTIPANADTVVGRPTISGANWPADYEGVVPGPFGTSTPIDLTLSPGAGATPVKYRYQLNDQAPLTVRAASGTAQVSITPTGRVGTLKVTAVAADGSESDTVSEQFLAESVPPAANQDINGDGVPDLVTAGGTPGLASGLWLAPGVKYSEDGKVRTPVSDIGALGAGFNTETTPADFDGAQVVVGDYFGDGFQDFLVYFTSGIHADGPVALLGGSGDGTVVWPYVGNQLDLYLWDYNGDTPIQFANAYDSRHVDGPADDLIAISGDASNGYYLNYYASTTGTIDYTQYKIAEGWNAGATLSTFQAAVFGDSDTPGLWTVTPEGVATAYTVTNLSPTGTAKIHAEAPQPLS